MEPAIAVTLGLVVALKLLLFNAYHSTDLEVHRNWLAITAQLPVEEWYVEAGSEWTLDYPPLFAWWQCLLGLPARLLCPHSLALSKDPIDDPATLRYQRWTVLVGDLAFFAAVLRFATAVLAVRRGREADARRAVAVLLLASPAFLMVDSVHFQYNGFVSAPLLLSLAAGLEGWRAGVLCAGLFGVALCLKHIFAYMVLAFVFFFLRHYVFPDESKRGGLRSLLASFSLANCVKVAGVLGAVLAVTFGPFVGQLDVVLARLFPFKRGLTHAYWAPNFWALYNALDLGLHQTGKRLGWLSRDEKAGYTTGLVQEYSHLVLPNVSPGATILLSLVVSAALGSALLVGPKDRRSLLRSTAVVSLTSFMFGWHVHEKAALVALPSLVGLAGLGPAWARLFLLFSTTTHVSLFPLLFQPNEGPLKVALTLAYLPLSVVLLQRLHRLKTSLLTGPSRLYLLGLAGLELLKAFVLPAVPALAKLDFLPLLLTSVYCGVGMAWCYGQACWLFLKEETDVHLWWAKRGWAREQERLKARLSAEDREEWQTELAEKGKTAKLRLVGGLDISFPEGDETNAVVSLVLLEWPSLRQAGSLSEWVTLDVPYAPGFLAFREAGHMVELVRRWCSSGPRPDVVLVDGNGVLHPRDFGLACHVGVLLDLPAVGVAKNLHLVGGLLREREEWGRELARGGDSVELRGQGGEVLGAALRTTEDAAKPVFVSVGHAIGLKTATSLVAALCRHRVPEPVRLADQQSRKIVRDLFDD